jgi:hypothetical protein
MTEIVLKVGLKTIPLTLILHSHLYNIGKTLFTDAPVYNCLFLRYIIYMNALLTGGCHVVFYL